MKHPYFHKAVQQAYERLIPDGTHVPYFIYFDVNPADIDVNIHPTKTEIKFENEQAIWQILSAAVKDAIGQFCDIPQIEFDTVGKPDIPAYTPNDAHAMPKGPAPKYNPFYNPFKQKATKDWEQLYEQLPQQPASSETSLFQTDEELVQQKSSDAQPLELTDISPSHYQYKGHYIMTAVKSGLMIIDQYRADVRIRYERYMHQLSHTPSQSQRLLFPEVLEMAPSDAALMDELQPLLTASSLIQDIVAAAVPVNHDSLALNSEVALQLARHAAIPYGQQLTNEEMDVLVNDLFACSNVNYTPDGHPILCITNTIKIYHFP